MQDNIEKIKKITVYGLVLNIFLTAAKATGGVLFFSQALIADAVHSLSDLVTDVIVLAGVKYWSAPPDESHPYGYGRIETIVSAVIGLILAGVAADLAIGAVKTVISGVDRTPELPALWIALFSVVSKEILYRKTVKTAVECSSAALRANAMQHRSDAVSSIPVALALLISAVLLELLEHIRSVFVIFLSFTVTRRITPATFPKLAVNK